MANTLGLNDSEFQYVIDALELDEMRREREERDAEDMRQVQHTTKYDIILLQPTVWYAILTNVGYDIRHSSRHINPCRISKRKIDEHP